MMHSANGIDGRGTRPVLLTGATGTLGFNLARLLAHNTRYHVVLPVRRVMPCLAGLGPQLETVRMDLSDQSQVEELLRRVQPDVIIHCAASGLRVPRQSWLELVDFNVGTTLRLFESYCRSQASHFIHVSTGRVYLEQRRPIHENDPVGTLHPYAASKAAADLLLQAAALASGRRLTIVRPFAFTGLRDFEPRLFPSLFHAAAARAPFPMTAGSQVRDFCAAADIARAVLLCVERTFVVQIERFNLGGGVPRTVRQWIETVCAELELTVEVQFGQIAGPPHDPTYLVADIEEARNKLGWSPKTPLSYAVWELAREAAPGLPLRKPECSSW
jgi:nucleoside-diphosphate-sugar epimerase